MFCRRVFWLSIRIRVDDSNTQVQSSITIYNESIQSVSSESRNDNEVDKSFIGKPNVEPRTPFHTLVCLVYTAAPHPTNTSGLALE